jgi:hypothetical protein
VSYGWTTEQPEIFHSAILSDMILSAIVIDIGPQFRNLYWILGTKKLKRSAENHARGSCLCINAYVITPWVGCSREQVSYPMIVMQRFWVSTGVR